MNIRHSLLLSALVLGFGAAHAAEEYGGQQKWQGNQNSQQLDRCKPYYGNTCNSKAKPVWNNAFCQVRYRCRTQQGNKKDRLKDGQLIRHS